MLLTLVAALGLMPQPEPEKLDIFPPGGRFRPEIVIPEKYEEPGRVHRRMSVRGLGSAPPVAPPPRPKADITSAAARGLKAAEADIKAGCPTIRVYGKRPISVRGLGEGDTGMVDADTGLPIRGVAGCMASDELVAEADAYNATIRAWHSKQKAK